MLIKNKSFRLYSFYFFVFLLFILGTALGNHVVTVAAELRPIERLNRIVIDAGHGGEDGGAISCSGKSESVFNLQIALRLNDLFHLLGYETVMIRSTDTAVYTKGDTIAQKKVSDLKQRVKIVSETPHSLLISIHENTYPESKYSGAQVFYSKSAGSQELAKLLQAELIASINPQSHREAKQGSGIYLLDKISSTGILVECGFLSNPEEEKLLCSPAYQKKLCCVIAASTARFLSST